MRDQTCAVLCPNRPWPHHTLCQYRTSRIARVGGYSSTRKSSSRNVGKRVGSGSIIRYVDTGHRTTRAQADSVVCVGR
eukprot:2337782-Rhodomonas_salina.6